MSMGVSESDPFEAISRRFDSTSRFNKKEKQKRKILFLLPKKTSLIISVARARIRLLPRPRFRPFSTTSLFLPLFVLRVLLPDDDDDDDNKDDDGRNEDDGQGEEPMEADLILDEGDAVFQDVFNLAEEAQIVFVVRHLEIEFERFRV